jgi:peptidoglycan/LPS O-acetylase OafA/YrhL
MAPMLRAARTVGNRAHDCRRHRHPPHLGAVRAPDHTQYLGRSTFANLDGLRCFSILAVLWYHVPIASPLPGALGRGFLGVDLFFVLSGFLITTLLLRERERHGRIALGAFYVRRTLRIFPIYYATILGYCLWLGTSDWAQSIGLREPFFGSLVHYLTYTSNWFTTEFTLRVTWSLATEEQFYLLWPPLLAWLGPRRGCWLVGGLFVLMQGASFGLFDSVYGGGFRPNSAFAGTTFAPILLGVLLANALHRPFGFGLLAWLLGARWLGPVLVALVVGAACLPEGPPLLLAEAVHFRGAGRLATHIAMAALLAHCVVREDTPLRHVLGARPVAYLGRISYGMYLLHAPLFLHWWGGAYQEFGLPTPFVGLGAGLLLFVVLTAATVLLAAASFHGFERPFLRLKRRFER